MQVTVNGKIQQVPNDDLTVQELLEYLGLAGGPVAVELNRVIVPRAEHPTRRVAEGDVLELVHFVGGG